MEAMTVIVCMPIYKGNEGGRVRSNDLNHTLILI
jgi:hypothetical protein